MRATSLLTRAVGGALVKWPGALLEQLSSWRCSLATTTTKCTSNNLGVSDLAMLRLLRSRMLLKTLGASSWSRQHMVKWSAQLPRTWNWIGRRFTQKPTSKCNSVARYAPVTVVWLRMCIDVHDLILSLHFSNTTDSVNLKWGLSVLFCTKKTHDLSKKGALQPVNVSYTQRTPSTIKVYI